jgi:Lipase (class 3)
VFDILLSVGDFCGCKAHKGMAAMADSIWARSGDDIIKLFETEEALKDYSLTIVGHSLGAGVSCLLQIKCHKERLLGDRLVKCYGFAPPPTLCWNEALDGQSAEDAAIQLAIDRTVCYIHDNDCVPFLSVMAVRRLATLMDTVDNRTEHIWAYRRFKIFWEWEPIPSDIVADVKAVEADKTCVRCCDGASKLVIPAKMVVWMKRNFAGTYEVFGCNPRAVADLNIYCCQDMLADHLVEPYEDALDELASKLDGTANALAE